MGSAPELLGLWDALPASCIPRSVAIVYLRILALDIRLVKWKTETRLLKLGCITADVVTGRMQDLRRLRRSRVDPQLEFGFSAWRSEVQATTTKDAPLAGHAGCRC